VRTRDSLPQRLPSLRLRTMRNVFSSAIPTDLGLGRWWALFLSRTACFILHLQRPQFLHLAFTQDISMQATHIPTSLLPALLDSAHQAASGCSLSGIAEQASSTASWLHHLAQSGV